MQQAVAQQCLISDLQAATIANLVIAGVTIALFVLQYRQHLHSKKIANANHKVALFDKRTEVFFDIEEFFRGFYREGRPSAESAAQLRYKARNAHFLFPDKPLQFVEEITRKAFEHNQANIVWEPLRARAFAGEELTPQEVETKDAALGKMHDIQNWFIQQMEDGRLQREFEPYIKLPETI